MVPISKMRFHDGVPAAEHTGNAWYVCDDFGDGREARVADGWYPIIASGRLQPWDDHIGEGDLYWWFFDGSKWAETISSDSTSVNPDGTVTTLGLFTTQEAAEAYIKNPKEFQ